MFPYLDLLGMQRRSVLRPSYFNDVEAQSPGYTVQRIASRSSSVNARLRKRYGQSGTLPFGQMPPALLPSGIAPPAVTLVGRPTLGSYLMVVQVTTGGPLSGVVFEWSSDGGITWTKGVAAAASVLLGATGMSALFPAVGTYDVSNIYSAATPVPEAVLQWVDWLVTADVATRHGINTNDPLWTIISGNAAFAEKQIEEAANSKDGLFDLPTSEDQASAVNTGGPRGYSEQSPYDWTYRQQAAAQRGGGRAWCNTCGGWPCGCRNGLVGS